MSSNNNGRKIQESTSYDPTRVRDLRKLVARGEGSTIEFKRKASDPLKIIREMVAFANTKGGILLVGVGDDGTIPGLKYPEDEAHVIELALKNAKPPFPVGETFIPLGGSRTVILFEILESIKKPHFLVAADGSKQYFVRVDDKSIRASRELKEIIKRKRIGKDIHFRYGEHEKFLMAYLEENKSITLKEFIRMSGMKRFYASHKLVLLVLANVLQIIPQENEDRYTLAF